MFVERGREDIVLVPILLLFPIVSTEVALVGDPDLDCLVSRPRARKGPKQQQEVIRRAFKRTPDGWWFGAVEV